MFTATSFPFADVALRDPVTGVVDGTLGNGRSRGNQPHIFYTNTGVEYWGGGRVASLVHSTPDGKTDLALPDNVRFYFLAGTQHGPGAFPPSPRESGQEMGNPTDYWWNMRALLTAMKDWVVADIEPPPSRQILDDQQSVQTPFHSNKRRKRRRPEQNPFSFHATINSFANKIATERPDGPNVGPSTKNKQTRPNPL